MLRKKANYKEMYGQQLNKLVEEIKNLAAQPSLKLIKSNFLIK